MTDIYKHGNQSITPAFFDGHRYSFYVVAYNEVGGSDSSSRTWVTFRDSSTVSAPGTPPAPTVVAGTAKVTATVAAGTSGGAPASYTVTAYAASGTAAGTCTVTGASGSCDVTALTAGSTYTVKASAKNTGGTSGESVASSPVTVVATVPGAPALTALSRRSKTEAWVTFSAPSSDGGQPVTEYTVTVKGPNGRTFTQSFPAPAGKVPVGSLNNGGFYTFTVRAVNSVGTSNPSNAMRYLNLG
jgi:titin